jgi:TRAP-type mannitol/chloroaromatic compound transport system permease small subunit
MLNDTGPEPDVTSAAEELLEDLYAAPGSTAPLDVPGGIPGLLYRLRVGVEAVTSACGVISWVLVWVVFFLGLFNVVTRYLSRFIERDIIVGEVFDLQWMLFGLLFLVALNYGVREGVNPRIDFWWADYPPRRKAWIDLVLHGLLLLPFLIMAMRAVWGWSLSAMGRSFDGSWSTWKVWEIWEQSGDAGGLPRGPIKLMILIGLFLMATQVLAEIIKQILVLMNRQDLAGVAEHEAPLRVE